MTSPAETLRAAAKVLRCAHRYPVQVLTDAEMEQLIGTGRPLADCLDCGSREDGQDVAAPLREPLASFLEGVVGLIGLHPDLERQHVDGKPCNSPHCRIVHYALALARSILGRTS